MTMPKEEMTWVASQRRWTRMHNGKRYYISAKKLGCPETKEASVAAANRYWIAKQAELDAQPSPLSRPEQIAMAFMGFNSREEWQNWLNQFDEEWMREEAIAMLQQDFFDRYIRKGVTLPKQLEHNTTSDIEQIQQLYVGKPPTPADQQVGTLAKQWLVKIRTKRVPDAAADCERRIRELLKHVDPSADAAELQWASILDSFHTLCCQRIREREADPEQGWSGRWAKDVFADARTFIRWLSDSERISPPRNLAHQFRFDIEREEPNPWTIQEVQTALRLADGPLKLYMLLALNCGYGSKDIADLKPSEVDLQAGIIDRYRSKARKYKGKRKLAFTLWPSTASLLREHAGKGERLLTTENGTPLRGTGRRDYVAKKFERFRDQHMRRAIPGFHHSFYELRKTGATLIGERYGLEYARYFLNQAPKSVAEESYVKLSPEKLAEAVRWLGEQLGQC
jgi:hypothetical protein